MARVHQGNLNSRVPDLRTMLNPVDEQSRSHDFDKKARDATTPRGGAGAGTVSGRGGGRGGRGGRGSDHVKCCYGCGEPGHFARECPTVTTYARSYARRGNQAYENDPSKSEAVEVPSVTPKFRAKPQNTLTKILLKKEPAKPLSEENVYINSLLAKIEQKENELEQRGIEVELLNGRVNEVTLEIISARAKNEEMLLNMNKLEEDLEKCREDLSSVRYKEEEMTWNLWHLQDEFEETKAHLKEKSKELEHANETADAEMMNLKLEIEQWRKAAKAVAAVLTGGVETCCKTPELEALVLYFSNRAAKRVSLGKIRKALGDCRMAARLDPNFLKVCLTAANCHLVLGEIDDALYNYRKCLESGRVCLDRRLTIEAFDGLQNAQKVVNYINRSADLLQKKTFESATKALEAIMEALSITCYSEKLLEMKGEALFMLQKYEEVVQMCGQTLAFAEMNCATTSDSNHVSDEERKNQLKLWRWNLMSRSYFHMAKLEMALVILEKKEQLTSSESRTGGPYFPLAATVRELLHCKSAGNEAYKAGRHREALDHYSNAILQSTVSRPFTAVCLCNRAAAHQALGEVIDAIADCNLAIALNGNYAKAILRRASLHEKIRDHEHAALDLQRLISLLEKRCVEKEVEDLRVARSRLSSINKYMKKGMTMDLYLILGLKGSESCSEVKKAYHKAALRHHPDKAGKFLARSESEGDGHVWKEIFATVHKDADRLFKIIGEAYAVLSDSNKRFKYNLEGAMNDDFEW